jgi:alpha-1,2-mannosyltransferase
MLEILAIGGFSVIIITLIILTLYLRLTRKSNTVGIFHPYCDAGGGGERVLFSIVNAILQKYPRLNIVIFTGDDSSGQEILNRCLERFGEGITPPRNSDRLR